MIAALLNTPRTENDWARWSFHHAKSHQAIADAIRSKYSINIEEFSLDPIPFNDFHGWLERNQSSHSAMNSAIGAQSSDVEDVDPNDKRQVTAWIWLHYLEHQNAERILGVSS